jgi:hypothetical protein
MDQLPALPSDMSTRLPIMMERARTLWEFSGVRMQNTEERRWLQADLEAGLLEGHLDLAVYAVRLAEAGDEICDAALRKVGAELSELLLQRQYLAAPGYPQIVTYTTRVLLNTEHKRPRGRPWHGNLVRDIRICLCIDQICRELGVRPTRNRTERRADRAGADRAPSGCSIVWAAVCGPYNITETHVQENIWGGAMAKRLRAHGIISP